MSAEAGDEDKPGITRAIGHAMTHDPIGQHQNAEYVHDFDDAHSWLIGVMVLYSVAGGDFALGLASRHTIGTRFDTDVCIANLDYHFNFAYPIYAGIFILLTASKFSVTGMGAQRWLDLVCYPAAV